MKKSFYLSSALLFSISESKIWAAENLAERPSGSPRYTPTFHSHFEAPPTFRKKDSPSLLSALKKAAEAPAVQTDPSLRKKTEPSETKLAQYPSQTTSRMLGESFIISLGIQTLLLVGERVYDAVGEKIYDGLFQKKQSTEIPVAANATSTQQKTSTSNNSEENKPSEKVQPASASHKRKTLYGLAFATTATTAALLSVKLHHLNKECNTKNKEAENLKKENEDLLKKLEDLNAQSDQNLPTLRAALSERSIECETLKGAYEKLEQDLAILSANLAAANTRREVLFTQNANLAHTHLQDSQNIDELTRRLKEQQINYRIMEEKVQRLEAEKIKLKELDRQQSFLSQEEEALFEQVTQHSLQKRT